MCLVTTVDIHKYKIYLTVFIKMAFRNQVQCFVCNLDGAPRTMRTFIDDNQAHNREIAERFRQNLGRPPAAFVADSRICISCFNLVNTEIQEEQNPASTRINVVRAPRGGACLICRRVDALVQRLSIKCRTQIFIYRNIYIPPNVRCCVVHLDNEGNLRRNLHNDLQYFERSYVLVGQDLQELLQMMRNNTLNNQAQNFTDESLLTDDEFSIISPINKMQFNEMLTFCDPVPQARGQRHIKKKDLILFLCKIRQGLSDDFLKLIFCYSTRQSVSLAISKVRQSLLMRFVPQNIGLNAIGRQAYIENHVTEFTNQLYNTDPPNRVPIVYIDGTYAYIEKSSNFQTLRFSYCVHKGRHLVKPALVVAPDGYILDIHGPYFSDSQNNDASMLQREFENDADGLRGWLGDGAIVIVDRGYRDAVPLLERLGIHSRMPAVLPEGQNQLSTEAANDSRLITKTRWIVEARNGHLKSIFKFFKEIILFHHVKHLRDFYLIAGAIINRYREPILMQGATAELAQNILARHQQPNEIQELITREGLQRGNAQWHRLAEQDILDFPVLHEDYLRQITIGIYQLGLAPAYIQDKLTRDDGEIIELDHHRVHQGLLRLRIHSRHRNRTSYQLWIKYNTGLDPPGEPIQGYYCLCKSGARTLGTCAHVAAVIWYLGYARHQANVKYPSNDLLHSVNDAGNRINIAQ